MSGRRPEEDKADKQDWLGLRRWDNNIMDRDEEKRSHSLLLA